MRSPRFSHLRSVLALMTLLILPMAMLADDTPVEPVAATPHFAFYSDFDTNLNDALIVAGVARNKDKPELFHSETGEKCFSELAPSARAGWNLAVDFYAEIISPNSWQDRQQVLLRHDLAHLDLRDDAGARRFLGVARGLMAAAAPAYETCRWEEQDSENRRWVEDLLPRLEEHGAAIAPPLAPGRRKMTTSSRAEPIRLPRFCGVAQGGLREVDGS